MSSRARRLVPAVLTLAALVVTAAPAAGSPPAATPATKHLAPLHTRASLTGTAVAKKLAAAKGGTLTATANGTIYRLTIPANALPMDMTVSIRPVARIAGLPAGTTVRGGVRIEPQGTQLLTAATLTISKARPAAKGTTTVGYTAPDSGTALSLALGRVRSGVIVVPVTHFSDHGAFSATNARLDTIAAHRAASTSDQIDSDFSRQIFHDGKVDGHALAEYDRTVFNEVVRPLLADALDRDSASSGIEALRAALALERELQLLGAGDGADFLGLSSAMVAYLFALAERSAYADCADKHDVRRGLSHFLALARQGQLIGVGGHDDPTGLDLAQRCYRFRLDFDSTFDDTTVDGTLSYHVLASPDLVLTPGPDGGFTFTGSGPVSYGYAKGELVHQNDGYTCTGQDTTTPTQAPVNKPVFEARVSYPFGSGSGSERPAPSAVLIDPGDPKERYHITNGACPGDTPPTGPMQSDEDVDLWQSFWGAVYGQQMVDGSHWLFAQWNPAGGAVIGTKDLRTTISGTDDDGNAASFVDHTIITLTHTPEPAPALPKKPPLPPKR